MLTVIVMCSLRSMCIPSYILVGCCVSELQGRLRPYCNVLPEAVYCHFTILILHVGLIIVIGLYHFTKFHSSTLSDIAKCIA